MTFVEVEHNENELLKHEWRFYLHDSSKPRLVLDTYCRLSRSAKRGRFKVEAWYDYHVRSSSLKLDEVPFPDWVIAKAKERLCDMVTVVKTLK